MITINQEEFKLLSGYIKMSYGIHLKDEKRSLIAGRLQKVLMDQGFLNFMDYYHHVVNDRSGKAASMLIDKITTNHTFFMREAEHFRYFSERVLPELTTTIRDKDLRTWCAASSTGEEAYTLAMLLDTFFDKSKYTWNTQILATDISNEVLEFAKQGVYHHDRIAPLPSQWKTKYFQVYDKNHAQVKQQLKQEVIFRRFNLMDRTMPFKRKFHVIFCRNVMIYFDQETKNELVQRFYDVTESGGYLFIGHSETLQKDTTDYQYMMPSVYRKR